MTQRCAGVSAAADETPAVRVYPNLRSAHLERFRRMAPAKVLYHRTRYDYDPSLADPASPPRRMGRLGVVVELLRRRYRVVEVSEPMMTTRWPDLFAQIVAVRIRGLLSGQRELVASYCIGLTDPAEHLRERWHLPRPLARLVARVGLRTLVRAMDRLAFGTTGCFELYAKYTGRNVLARRAEIFEAVPAACDCLDGPSTPDPGRGVTLLFVGIFEERKGIPELVAVWDELRRRQPQLRLHIVGKGRMVADVTEWAGRHPEVTLDIDPPRAVIHRALRDSAVLILLSQRMGAWREQVGLPIVEGLAHGCEIVTTSQTGLAEWLQKHGHLVVEPDASAADVADAVGAVFTSTRLPEKILEDLPNADSRIAADAWMFGPRVPRRGRASALITRGMTR